MERGHVVLCESGVGQRALATGMHVVSFIVELGCMCFFFLINSRRQSFGDGVSERWQIDLTDTVPHWVCYITSLDVGRVGLFETMQFRSNESADVKCG